MITTNRSTIRVVTKSMSPSDIAAWAFGEEFDPNAKLEMQAELPDGRRTTVQFSVLHLIQSVTTNHEEDPTPPAAVDPGKTKTAR